MRIILLERISGQVGLPWREKPGMELSLLGLILLAGVSDGASASARSGLGEEGLPACCYSQSSAR